MNSCRRKLRGQWKKHCLRLCNCHSGNKAIFWQCIKDNFFASPQRMLPKSRDFKCIKINPDREKTHIVKEMLSLIKLRCLGFCSSWTMYQLLFIEISLITLLYQIKMCKSKLLFKTDKQTWFHFWGCLLSIFLVKTKVHIFKRKIFIKEK